MNKEPNVIKSLFKSLLRIRLVENKIIELYPEQEMRCPIHLSVGQESVAVGVCASLNKEDKVISSHRGHAHYLAKGGNLKSMIAELYGKNSGCSHGRGGSMHLIDMSVGFLGSVPIVGSGIPIGVGAAFGSKIQNINNITVIFFGDAATESGYFHESLNFAALHRLRILFVCENNKYSVHSPLKNRQAPARSIMKIARAHGVKALSLESYELEKIYELAKTQIQNIKRLSKPCLIEFHNYRLIEHCGIISDRHLTYRPKGEYELWEKRDPLYLNKKKLISEGILLNSEIKIMEMKINNEITQAFEYAKRAPFPSKNELLNNTTNTQEYSHEKR